MSGMVLVSYSPMVGMCHVAARQARSRYQLENLIKPRPRLSTRRPLTGQRLSRTADEATDSEKLGMGASGKWVDSVQLQEGAKSDAWIAM